MSKCIENRGMNIEITKATIEERPVLRHLMELYLYDFSEFDHADPGPSGLYEYPFLDHYWIEQERTPFLVRADDKLAGFVLVTRYNYLTRLKDNWVIAEFFVLRKYRRKGIGDLVARFIFDLFPGAWQVGEIFENKPAIAFWRNVIAHYTHGKFQEYQLDDDNWHGPIQTFISPSSSSQNPEP